MSEICGFLITLKNLIIFKVYKLYDSNFHMELPDLEMSFQEIENLQIAKYLVLPINAEIEKFQGKIEKLKFPLWIKLNSSEHKLKLDAVKKVSNLEELKKIYSELQKKFQNQKFILQEDVKGIELIAGIKQDKTFDKVLLIGSGGSLAELVKDIEFRILPVDKEEIEKAIKDLRIYKLIEEKNLALNKLIDLIKKFSDLTLEKNIEEADLNPIIVNETQATIVDARIQVKDED